ncbi:MAG: iron-sulfur cluster assembly scaffold protein [archaeon]|nr:iron-sulfur cluster assembly scaffold protein [archaeon]
MTKENYADLKSRGGEESWFYSKTVKEHFFNPKNFISDEEISNYKYDGLGMVGSPACGDVMKVWIKIDEKGEKIKELKWQTFGCASAIASTSMLSVMVTENGGMKIEKALKLRPKDILKRLDGLPKIKIHCSVLGDKALRSAIDDYLKRKNGEKIYED